MNNITNNIIRIIFVHDLLSYPLNRYYHDLIIGDLYYYTLLQDGYIIIACILVIDDGIIMFISLIDLPSFVSAILERNERNSYNRI